MNPLDHDHCEFITGGSIWPPMCDWPLPEVVRFPDCDSPWIY